MSKTAEESFGNAFIEVFTRVFGDNLLAQFGRESIETVAQHIQADAREKQRDFRLHVLCHARSGVKRNRLPSRLSGLGRNAVRNEKGLRGVRAIYFEALTRARILA